MHPRAIVVAAALLIGASAATWADGIVIVAEDGGYAASTVRTVRSIAATALRERGISLIEGPRFAETTLVGPETLAAVAELGADRVFVLRFGALQKKVVITLEEIALPSPTPVFVASLAASDIDEADTVVPRLVAAVLDRAPVEKGARIATVTDQEAKPFRKKPGEGLFVLGLGLVPLGGSIGWSYEAKSWRLGLLLQGANDDVSFFGFEGAWIPYDGNVSPYLGAGLGIVGPENDGGDGVLGTKLEAGVEFFRLHGVRLMVGLNAIVPFESRPGTDSVNFGLHLRVGF
jgi:hypothetical protein